jgi:hypothetical protein
MVGGMRMLVGVGVGVGVRVRVRVGAGVQTPGLLHLRVPYPDDETNTAHDSSTNSNTNNIKPTLPP